MAGGAAGVAATCLQAPLWQLMGQHDGEPDQSSTCTACRRSRLAAGPARACTSFAEPVVVCEQGLPCQQHLPSAVCAWCAAVIVCPALPEPSGYIELVLVFPGYPLTNCWPDSPTGAVGGCCCTQCCACVWRKWFEKCGPLQLKPFEGFQKEVFGT